MSMSRNRNPASSPRGRPKQKKRGSLPGKLLVACLVLSFFGPARFAPVQLVILGMLVLPWAVILPFYRRETYLVRAQLRQIFPVIE